MHLKMIGLMHTPEVFDKSKALIHKVKPFTLHRLLDRLMNFKKVWHLWRERITKNVYQSQTSLTVYNGYLVVIISGQSDLKRINITLLLCLIIIQPLVVDSLFILACTCISEKILFARSKLQHSILYTTLYKRLLLVECNSSNTYKF